MTDFEQRINYSFKNHALLEEALSHSSYVHGKNNHSNERLEFLGDSVLSVVVSNYLFINLKNQPEGNLTRLRSSIVCENALYRFAKKIDLGSAILLGKGEENTGGRERRSILADAFEAVIAAIYLDGGLEAATKFVLPFVPSLAMLKSGKLFTDDHKTLLQEIIQQNPEEHVEYELQSENGSSHNKSFVSNVLLNGQIIGTGTGSSKKDSEQAAAKEALELMGYDRD